MRIALLAAFLGAGVVACADFEGEVPDSAALHFPVGVAVHPSGRYVYAVSTNFDASYRVDRGGMVSVLDLDALTIDAATTVRIGSYGGAARLTPDARHLLVTTRGDDSLVVLDVSEDGSSVSCRGSDDGLRCRVTDVSDDPFDVTVLPFEPQGADVAESPENTITAAVTGLAGDVTMVTIRNGDLAGADVFSEGIIDGASTLALHPQTGEVFVAGRFSNNVAALSWFRDAQRDVAGIVASAAATIPTTARASDARDLAFAGDGRRAFVTTNSPAGLVTLDTTVDGDGHARIRYLARHDLDGAPVMIAPVREGDREVLYVALADDDAIAVVDADSGVREATIRVGARPFDLAVDPTRPRLYVSLFEDNAIGIVDIDPSSAQFRSLVARIR